MKLTITKIALAILFVAAVANATIYFQIDYLYIRAIVNTLYLLLVPGYLIALSLKLQKVEFWEYLVYVVGFSVAFIMFGGLLLNWVLPMFGISNPLSLIPVSIGLHSAMLILLVVAIVRNKKLKLTIKLPSFSLKDWFFLIIPTVFPVLAALGAVSLNNRGSNSFTMMMLFGIALYILTLLLQKKAVNENVYPVALFFIGMSVLFMTSLRGWYTTGHDNQQEYYVYQLTQQTFHWSMSVFVDTYNACLSLNILPTILNAFLHINDLYIFKVIFQVIFPFTAIGIYLLLKKYSSPTIAFLSAFFFVSFPTFGNDMPMLNRQEIALLYFMLTLLVLFSTNFKPAFKNGLFLIFACSMVVSHYSTSYIATAMIAAAYFLSIITRYLANKKGWKIGNNKYYITWIMVIGTLFFTFFWNAQVTKTTKGFEDVMTKTFRNIGNALNQDLKSGDTRYSLFNWDKPNKEKLYLEYVESAYVDVKNDPYSYTYFPEETYLKYEVPALNEEVLPVTKIGESMSKLHVDPYTFNNIYKQGSAKLVQVLLIVGFVVMLLKKTKYTKVLDSEYGLLCAISIALLMVFILLPMISNSYGTLRFFLQTLNVLALPTVVGTLTVLSFLKERTRLLLTTLFFISFFLSLYGFISQLTGGFNPSLNLNNKGYYYDVLYTHPQEVQTIDWLTDHGDKETTVQFQTGADAGSRMLSFSSFKPVKYIFPALVQRYSYVFFDYTNVHKQQSTIFYKGFTHIYRYPVEFLDDNKNLLYNTDSTRIYR